MKTTGLHLTHGIEPLHMTSQEIEAIAKSRGVTYHEAANDIVNEYNKYYCDNQEETTYTRPDDDDLPYYAQR